MTSTNKKTELGMAVIKMEDGKVEFDYLIQQDQIRTRKQSVYIERCIPWYLEDAVNNAIDEILKIHGENIE